jgi:hypothetical protein
VNPLLAQAAGLIKGLDVTEAFKTKGDLRRWSAKRTVGGLIATTACGDVIAHGMSWPAVAMCAVAIVPLCLSFLESD